MLRLIEAKNFRCLRYVSRPLDQFQVLVGPNGSGKSTFLDIVSFLGRIVSSDLETAIFERTQNFEDLLWRREGKSFELVIEVAVPAEKQEVLKRKFDTIRYEVQIGEDQATKTVGILEERAILKNWTIPGPVQARLFPLEFACPPTLLRPKPGPGQTTVLNKVDKGIAHYYPESTRETWPGGRYPVFRLAPSKSALANLVEDESLFPVSTWLKGLLKEGVQSIILNSLIIRKASPPDQGRTFKTDGSNLPWVISDLAHSNRRRFKDWLAHLRTALPGLENIKTIVRPDDRKRYLEICFRNGLRVPSWMVSDGTLRLLALTIPAYLPDLRGVYLIEEPENGIHPTAVDTMFQSLASVYNAQVLLATHSPVILSMAKRDQVLCFKQTESGATDIVSGDEHPDLRDWQGSPNLSVLFASGVLG